MSYVGGAKEVLVPIRIDFDVDGYKITDSFTWNLNGADYLMAETTLLPEKFAEYICTDMGINPQIYIPQIANALKSQLADHRRFYQTLDFPIPEDSRITIKLDLFAGRVHLRDRFEWDIAGQESPEEFAAILSRDLGLGGEFQSLISHRYLMVTLAYVNKSRKSGARESKRLLQLRILTVEKKKRKSGGPICM